MGQRIAAVMVGAACATGALVMVPAPVSANAGFVRGGDLSGGVYYFQRNRVRWDPATETYRTNLNHATAQAAMTFTSGYAGGVAGVDLGAFAARDLVWDATSAPDHEFAFFADRWGEWYDNGCTTDTCEPGDGVSVHKAAGKLRSPDGVFQARAGLTQLYVPGVIGVNWSFQPGTYRGAQLEADWGDLYLTYAWADEYKAPWYRYTQDFFAVKEWSPLTADAEVDFIHGVGAKYRLTKRSLVQLGYGQAEGLSEAYHAKLSHELPVADGVDLSYQFYGTDTTGPFSYYQGLAWQQAVTAGVHHGPYHVRTEFLWTKAEGEEGNYLPRLTRGYANSQGALEVWWDARSDWNEHNEKALFVGVWRELDDLVGAPGWTVGVSYAYGWDAMRQIQNSDGVWVEDSNADRGRESALNLDVSYRVQEGALAGTLFKFHYTDYRNHQDEQGSWYYPNMFASEKDAKIQVIVPVDLL